MHRQFEPARCLKAVLAGALLAVCLPVTFAAGNTVELVRDDRPLSVVVLPEDPLQLETLAAEELVNHLKLMNGAELPILSAGDEIPRGMLPVYLGSAADETLDGITRGVIDNPSSFTLRADTDRIDIRGLSDEGTLIGVYELLEQIGFRWYSLGDLGRVIPEGDTVRLAIQTETQGPTMVFRRLQHIPDTWPWTRRARIGGEERSTGQHGIPGLPRNAAAFEADPEMFSLVGDERRARQDCLSNPKVLQQVVAAMRQHLETDPQKKVYVGASSHDGGGYCQCDGCQALDRGVYDPTADRESMTDRYIWLFNRVLEELDKEFPGHQLHIVTYTYGAHMMPPDIEVDARIVPVFAPITIDRIRGMDNPMSPDRHLLRWLIDEWSDRGVKEMYYRGYYNNLACPQFPFSQLDRIRHETPEFARMGVTVMRVECIMPAWSSNFINWYLAARMMWNIDTDVDALLDEFYTLYYGPAREPMKRYHEELESAFRDTPYFTGSSYVYFPIFIGHPRRDRLRELLDEARLYAEHGGRPGWLTRRRMTTERHPEVSDPMEAPNRYARRVAAVRFNWDRMDAFLDMIDARNNHDFATAYAMKERVKEFTAFGASTPFRYEDTGYVYSRDGRYLSWREHPDQGGNYLGRFFSRPIDSGYERAVEIGEIVTPLADEWLFLLDPAEIGEISGYYRPGILGGNWQPMKTSTRSWSDQGLHYYKGIAWYRQKITIPAAYENRPLYLWFGGVDRLASIWINGVFMGTSREPREGIPGVPGSFRPFDVPTVHEDGSSALNFGGENWVVVRIENKSLAELGTGGILAPVMFWSPKDPNWKP